MRRPGQTLAQAGVQTGSVIFVDAPGAPALIPTPPVTGSRPFWGAPLAARRARGSASRWAIRRLHGRCRGGVHAGWRCHLRRDQLGELDASKPAEALAADAAAAWVNASPFTGPRLSGVPADLGRSGPTATSTLEAVGSSTSGGISSRLFIVDPASGPAYGLSVVVFNGCLAYPPTLTPLPFASSVPAGTDPVVPQTGTIVAPTATRQAQTWAQATFGSPARPTDQLGYGLAGPVTAVNQWKPNTGAALVTRVRMPLATSS